MQSLYIQTKTYRYWNAPKPNAAFYLTEEWKTRISEVPCSTVFLKRRWDLSRIIHNSAYNICSGTVNDGLLSIKTFKCAFHSWNQVFDTSITCFWLSFIKHTISWECAPFLTQELKGFRVLSPATSTPPIREIYACFGLILLSSAYNKTLAKLTSLFKGQLQNYHSFGPFWTKVHQSTWNCHWYFPIKWLANATLTSCMLVTNLKRKTTTETKGLTCDQQLQT